MPAKAILLLDNASCHPVDIQSDDGLIITAFMPPNLTSMIQPMDQNVIRLTKLFYRRSLLALLAARPTDSVILTLKSISLKDVCTLLNAAWQNVPSSSIEKSWKNIFTISSENDGFCSEDDLPLTIFRQRLAPSENLLRNTLADVSNLANNFCSTVSVLFYSQFYFQNILCVK